MWQMNQDKIGKNFHVSANLTRTVLERRSVSLGKIFIRNCSCKNDFTEMVLSSNQLFAKKSLRKNLFPTCFRKKSSTRLSFLEIFCNAKIIATTLSEFIVLPERFVQLFWPKKVQNSWAKGEFHEKLRSGVTLFRIHVGRLQQNRCKS